MDRPAASEAMSPDVLRPGGSGSRSHAAAVKPMVRAALIQGLDWGWLGWRSVSKMGRLHSQEASVLPHVALPEGSLSVLPTGQLAPLHVSHVRAGTGGWRSAQSV